MGAVREENVTHVMCYLDLDRFKVVNDTCGHIAGDNMLREIAGLIREQVRESDFVARLGGDEFGMLLIGCPLDKARQIADDVCGAVRDFRFVWQDRIFTVGVSVGLVEIAHWSLAALLVSGKSTRAESDLELSKALSKVTIPILGDSPELASSSYRSTKRDRNSVMPSKRSLTEPELSTTNTTS